MLPGTAVRRRPASLSGVPRGATVASSAQPVHEHRRVGEGIRIVDESPQELVVPGGRHVEITPDGLFLCRRVRTPRLLEIEEDAITFGQCHTDSVGTPRCARATPLP